MHKKLIIYIWRAYDMLITTTRGSDGWDVHNRRRYHRPKGSQHGFCHIAGSIKFQAPAACHASSLQRSGWIFGIWGVLKWSNYTKF